MRSASFLRRMGGHVATLMDYSRFNYVAQPEDSIPVELLIPKVGPVRQVRHDVGEQADPRRAHAARTSARTLDQLGAHAGHDPVAALRRPTDASADPYDLTEAVGDEDAVKSSRLGLRNLQRVMTCCCPSRRRRAATTRCSRGCTTRRSSQWGRYNGHVAAIIGGAETQERYGTGERFTPVAEAEAARGDALPQRERVPRAGVAARPDVLRRIEQEGAVQPHPHRAGPRAQHAARRLARSTGWWTTRCSPRPGATRTASRDLLGDLRARRLDAS